MAANHDEDDQIDALTRAVQGEFEASISTAKSNPDAVSYLNAQSADLLFESTDGAEFCESGLFRFQKANGNPSPNGYSRVFNSFQDHCPRSYVANLAEGDVRATKTLVVLT
jgi:hypothetical protein